MKRLFKVTMFFLVLLFSVACNNYNNEQMRMVSADYNNSIRNSAVNKKDENILKANVLIVNDCYSSIFGIKYRSSHNYGSGVIVKEDRKYLYVLTNNHVVANTYNYFNQNIIIEDYFSNKYEGEIVRSNINYDLALIRFKKQANLSVLKVSDEAALVRENIISMGNPNSVKNVLSEGAIDCYTYVSISNENSNVDFEVIMHDAEIDNGSSGGALLNNNNEIVGLTFAGVFDTEGNFITGYAIPSSKIIEFLNN